MRIMTNIESLNAWRNLTSTDGALSKSLERLSSGYRINRAADDAAGLAMSERMRAQVKGMNQAVRNAHDGISFVQTAEGSLNEIHTILQRMRELSVQAGNGTLTGADRNQIQTEVDELASEITRITNTTQFKSKELLNGAMNPAATGVGGGTGPIIFQIGPNQNQTMNFNVSAMDGKTLGIARDLRETQDNNNLLNTIQLTGTGLANGDYSVTVTYNGTTNAYTADILDSAGASITGSTTGGAAITPGQTATITGTTGAHLGESLKVTFDNQLPGLTGTNGSWTAQIEVNRAAATVFQAGYKSTDAVTIGGIDVTTEANATSAITAINTAINTVAAQRAQLGAMQNRLEHTINNLQVVSENLVSSESRIRDVDMAMEMASFTKNQILMQAGTAMLAQANAKNQAVLQLLR